MSEKDERERQLSSQILNGSTTMIGVSITVIALFKVLNMSLKTYADELLAIDNFFFTISAVFAYAAIRKVQNRRLERIADISFLIGMLLMLAAGILIIYSET